MVRYYCFVSNIDSYHGKSNCVVSILGRSLLRLARIDSTLACFVLKLACFILLTREDGSRGGAEMRTGN
jgi:hypothetical protein